MSGAGLFLLAAAIPFAAVAALLLIGRAIVRCTVDSEGGDDE